MVSEVECSRPVCAVYLTQWFPNLFCAGKSEVDEDFMTQA